MKVGGRWLRSSSPSDTIDDEIASDTIQFTVYQSVVSLEIPDPLVELEPDSGVLRLFRSSGDPKTVYINRPDRKGFVISGPKPDGIYHITYEPNGDEVNPIGTTKAQFRIYDLNGNAHEAQTILDTP